MVYVLLIGSSVRLVVKSRLLLVVCVQRERSSGEEA